MKKNHSKQPKKINIKCLNNSNKKSKKITNLLFFLPSFIGVDFSSKKVQKRASLRVNFKRNKKEKLKFGKKLAFTVF